MIFRSFGIKGKHSDWFLDPDPRKLMVPDPDPRILKVADPAGWDLFQLIVL